MVRSMKLAFILSLLVAFTLASSSEDNERVNLDHETIVKLLNETIQHWQVSAEETAEIKEMLRQLRQERREEMHRKCEGEDVELSQLREELRQLKEEGRENQLHAVIDSLRLQDLVIEIQHEQQKQPAALNISLDRFIQQHQMDLHALKAIITERGAVEASEELQQCRNESQAASDALTTQANTCFGILENYELSFSHEGRWFYMNNYSKLTWNEARTWCQALGGDLAQPSCDMTGFLQKVASKHSNKVQIWLGATDQQQEGEWKWVSGTDLPAGFPWGENEPNNHRIPENCLDVYFKTEGPVYNDFICSEKGHFACELGPAR